MAVGSPKAVTLADITPRANHRRLRSLPSNSTVCASVRKCADASDNVDHRRAARPFEDATQRNIRRVRSGDIGHRR